MIRRRILFLNILLLLMTSIFAYQLVSSWSSFQGTHGLERVAKMAQQEVAPQEVSPLDLQGRSRLSHDFFVIAERDLFSPERRLEAQAEDEVMVAEAPKFPQRPQMQGAATLNGEKQAFITVFSSSANRTQGENRTIQLGDDVQGYTVTEITDTTVTLRWNDTVEVIDMMDSEPVQQASAGQQSTAAVNIIKIGSRHAAVETTTASTDEGAEGQGLQVGVVGGERGRGVTGAAQGMTGSRSRMPGQSGANRMGGRSRGGTSGAAGIVGGGQQTVPRQSPE